MAESQHNRSKQKITTPDKAVDATPIEKTSPRRINVAINPDMLMAIDNVIGREQVTLTEAVRRLITYGDVIYRAVKEDHAAVVLRSPSGERELVLI